MAVGLCFVSADNALADRVTAALGVRGLQARAWIVDAPDSGAPDNVDDWLAKLEAGIVLWTPALVALRRGWGLAAEAAGARGRARLLHVVVGVEHPLPPLEFVSVTPLDGWGGAPDAPQWQALVRALDDLLAPRMESLATDAGDAGEPNAPELDGVPRARIGAAAPVESQASQLGWLGERRLAAAAAGVAPFLAAEPTPAALRVHPMTLPARLRGLSAPTSVSAPPSAQPPTSSMARGGPTVPSAPPPRASSGGSRGAVWGAASAAVVGVVLIGSTVLLQNGRPQVASPGPSNDASTFAANEMVGSPDNAVTASPPDATPRSDPVQALVGKWGLDGACERPTWLSVVNGHLFTQGPAAAIDVGEIQSVDASSGDVVVRQPPGDATTYHVMGDFLTVTSGQHPALLFARCRNGEAAANNAASGEAALIAMAVAGAGGAAAAPGPPLLDDVDVSAFAPTRLRAGDTVLVQIYLHLVEQAESALERARAADPAASPRGQTTLGLELARGTRVDIMLDAGGLGLQEPIQPVVWRGRPCAAQFAVSAPPDAAIGQRVLTARMLVDGVPLGRLAFSMTIAPAAEPPAADFDLRGDAAKRYARAFLSYSTLDRPEVLKTAQTLAATGIEYFQDILSIEPGEAWRTRLFAEIDRCDLFLLFWSSHAAASDWVRREAEYALGRRRSSAEESPDIRPIILEGPPVPRPPASLAELHFNDMLRYVVAASELEAKARQADT